MYFALCILGFLIVRTGVLYADCPQIVLGAILGLVAGLKGLSDDKRKATR